MPDAAPSRTHCLHKGEEDKMRMRKRAITYLKVALVVAAFALPSFSQSGGETDRKDGRHGQMGMPSVDDHVKHLTKQLNLTEERQAKVKSILEEQQKQMAALRQDSTLSPEDRRAKFQEIHRKTSQEIREALNKGQQRKFDELESKHKGRMKEHHGPPSQSDQQ